ncbi:transposase family protein [Streptomyces sp. NPDC057302]|uniref:transposase family protein n=1 Tax=Streptomyces sp. NPDC057302 TaxID=3346094 RepID=UPI0036397913
MPDRPGVRLKALEDVFAYAEAEGVELRLDGAETQVRRPQAGHPGRRVFVSGKRRQNTIKTTTFSDGQGRMLLAGVVRPGRMHDQTAMRTEGIAEQFRLRPRVEAKADSGYAALAKEFPGQVTAPPKKPKDEVCDGDKYAWREARRRQSSARVCVEHPRRATAVGTLAALYRTPRHLRRDPPHDRRPRLRPYRPAAHPPRDEHRTRPRP